LVLLRSWRVLIVMFLFLGTTDRTELILSVICCFSRIDFELVSPYVTYVLPVVAKVNTETRIYGSFLPDYHFPAFFIIKSSGRIS